jgi:hypothetical protein
LGASDQGARNGHALTLPTREFMRVFVKISVSQANCIQHVLGHYSHACRGVITQYLKWFSNDANHGLTRVKGAKGVLENHLKISTRCP